MCVTWHSIREKEAKKQATPSHINACELCKVYAGEKIVCHFVKLWNRDDILFKECDCFKWIWSMTERKVYYYRNSALHVLERYPIHLYCLSIISIIAGIDFEFVQYHSVRG